MSPGLSTAANPDSNSGPNPSPASDTCPTHELVLRPKVGMRQMASAPYVVALGVCDAVPNARIAWPHDVEDVESGTYVAQIRAHAGYDDEGMFVRVTLPNEQCVTDAVRARVDAWAKALEGRPRIAPLVPVLADYADRLALLGEAVRVTYPNGREYARGEFCGIDVWGRATVRLTDGSELEFSPERFRISPRG